MKSDDAMRGRDDGGAGYLMVVNLRQGPNMTAAQAAGSFTVKLDPTVQAVWRLSRQTGRPEKLAVTNGSLRLTLPGGTGDLLKIANGVFPGL